MGFAKGGVCLDFDRSRFGQTTHVSCSTRVELWVVLDVWFVPDKRVDHPPTDKSVSLGPALGTVRRVSPGPALGKACLPWPGPGQGMSPLANAPSRTAGTRSMEYLTEWHLGPPN